MEQKKDNIQNAIVFSVLIAVAGAIVWGVIYTLGWMVSLVAYATAFFMLKVYNKYASNSGKGKYVYIFLAVMVLNVIASFVALGVYCADYWGVEVGESIDILIENFDLFSTEFITDMFVGCIFTGLGIISAVGVEKREKQRLDYEEKQRKMAEEEKEQKQSDSTEETSVEKEIKKQKFCTYCGSKLEEDSTKCQNCGNSIEE